MKVYNKLLPILRSTKIEKWSNNHHVFFTMERGAQLSKVTYTF
jgi:hypothetical protein